MAHRNGLPIQQRRGNDCYDVDDTIVLVNSPIEPAALALNQILPMEHWEQDIYESEIEVRKQSFIVFQFQGHSWTCIHEYNSSINFKVKYLKALSKLLDTRVILHTVSDTCNTYGHYCYDAGKLMEELYWTDSYEKFKSRLRSFDYEGGYVTLADDFWNEQPDIYIPALVQTRYQYGQRVTLRIEVYGPETFERNDFVRVDYMALRKTGTKA